MSATQIPVELGKVKAARPCPGVSSGPLSMSRDRVGPSCSLVRPITPATSAAREAGAELGHGPPVSQLQLSGPFRADPKVAAVEISTLELLECFDLRKGRDHFVYLHPPTVTSTVDQVQTVEQWVGRSADIALVPTALPEDKPSSESNW